MRWNIRTYVDRIRWIRHYPEYPQAPLRHAARAVAFTWAEQQAAPGHFEFRACNGARFQSPPNNISSFIAATFGERDCNIVRFWRHALRPGAVFFDVGANIGLYTVSACRLAGRDGRVVAFEAHPETFRYLYRNVSRNIAAGVTIENLAVGARPGFAPIVFNAGNPGETHVAASNENSDTVVRAVTLDDYCRKAKIAAIDYMKIDVEGYEASVLNGARDIIAASDGILIQTEYEPRHMARYGDSGSMAALLTDWGFRPFRIGWTTGEPHPIADLGNHSGEVVWSRHRMPAMQDIPAGRPSWRAQAQGHDRG